MFDFIAGAKECCSRNRHIGAPLFRREFTLECIPEKATLKIACVGFYELFLNGEDITKGYLAPYISNYNDIIYYDEYEVAGKLRKENVICVLLGNGFADPQDFDVWGFESSSSRRPPCFALSLTNGESEIVSSDLFFEVYGSAITYDDIRCGERFDARLYRKELFNYSGGKEYFGGKKPIKVDLPKTELRKCEADPVKEEKRLHPKSIIPVDGGYIFDFGENNAGIVHLRIDGIAGQKITFDFGETIIDGKLDKRNIVNGEFDPSMNEYVQHDEYICKDGYQEWQPCFTYHGFQYVFVCGLNKEQVSESTLEYVVIHSDVKKRADFQCDNPTINKIYECTLRSDLSNLVYFPTDCPHREKNGWTADAALSAEQFLYNFSCEKTLAEWMRNVCHAQKQDGMLPGIVPTYGWGYAWGNGPAWDCVIVEIPYQIYRFCGDIRIIKENMPSVLRYFDFIDGKADDSGLVKFGLGDWCEAESELNHIYSTPVEYTNALTLLDMAEKTSVMLHELKTNITDEEKMRRRCDCFKNSFRRNYIKDGRVTVQTQTALAMAITSSALNEEEKQTACEDLMNLLEKRNYRMKVGVLGAKKLFDALTRFGKTDIALKTIIGPDYPSYGYMMENGATTLWESFYKLKSKGVPLRESGRKIDSLNHHFWGTVVGWFYRVIGGLDIVSCNKVNISVPNTRLIKSAQVVFENGNNKIIVKWKKINDKTELLIDNDGFQGVILSDEIIPIRQGKRVYNLIII